MGNFVIDVEAVGGHGCQREKGDGARIESCGSPGCPDCLTRRFVEELRRVGCSLVRGRLIHWPGQQGSVEDDLLSGIRTGSF